ncbi:MAG TPA: S46 family peptidase [Bacteroidales bacterium]|nr:S46 family peptidase [Bacteroidales bacterium]
MKKTILFLLIGLFAFAPLARADEGMWLLMFLDKQTYKDMKAKGLKLSPKQIYDINQASLKDAIVQFGRGCTGEIISDEGLLLTNHHCGYPQIQQHSTVEHDYLMNGFWAYSKAEELPCPGLTAKFLIRMDDVSSKVLMNITKETTEEKRASIIRDNIKKIREEAEKDNGYIAQVAPMFDGNQYILFVYEVYKDVRMVGAPPSSIGKFGSDTDNWMWPRHTGDFSMFRVYANKDNKPAEFAQDNVPFKPKHSLPISLKGVKNDDFTMIIGFPGSTDRFMTSYGVEQAIDVYNPSVVVARTALRNVMDADMKADPKVRIQYAAKFAQLSNYWKFYIGQTKCLQDLDVKSTKKDLETRLAKWISEKPERKAEYGNVLEELETYSQITNEFDYLRVFTNEAFLRGNSGVAIARNFSSLEKELRENGNTDKAKKLAESAKISLEDIFKDFNYATELKLLATGYDIFFRNVPNKHQSENFLDNAFKNKYDFNKIAKQIFDDSQMLEPEKAYKLLENPTADKIANDPMFKTYVDFINNYNTRMQAAQPAYAALNTTQRMFVKGIMEMDNQKHFAPNANSTIRYTYGQVKEYKPKDGITYNNYTTLEGIMAKEDTTSWEFTIPQKLKDLYKTKNYGQYAQNGTVPVCFITNNDITGGNSGSPVINGRGELVGIAFDGNWEAMSGNIAFNPDLQRCINVDIRYVLFIIDKFAGAQNLIKEMKIVK